MLARCQRDDLLREAGTKLLLGGLVTGILIGGCCSVFGPGVGVSVY